MITGEAMRALLASLAPDEAAPRMLGARLRAFGAEGTTTVRLTEVEAYAGETDLGSHAYRGRTARNATMFGEAGRLYVYFAYGMHRCANVVVGPPGASRAVLLRGGEVVEGASAARSRRAAFRRPESPPVPEADLARGPANLARALGIELADDGADLAGADLNGADVAGADVAGAGADLADPRLDGADVADAGLDGADLDGADVAGPRLDVADVADLGDADLADADFAGAGFALELLDEEEWLERAAPRIRRSLRTGVAAPGGLAPFDWRWYLEGAAGVSPYRPHPSVRGSSRPHPSR